MTRINKVLEVMAKQCVDSVIIKDVTTIRYLTGFTGDSSLLYLDREQGTLITDGRYTEQAKNEMKHFHVLEYTPVNASSIWAAAAKLAQEACAKAVGFDGAYYSYNDYVALQGLLGETPLVSVDLSSIRMIKDKKELDLLLKAASIADEAFIKLLDDIEPGRTERGLAGRLEFYMKMLGSEKPSFDTIVASGARSALPHGMASDKVIAEGDFVTFDFGAVYKGYHSDMTRTLVVGESDSWQQDVYEVVLEAQLKGLRAAEVGMTGRELDAIVRDYITDCGYGDYYVHGTGHGVGLEIHEMPNINKRGSTVLQTGMIFTIEPGIYIPGKGGVRIEDTVVLTEEGARALNGVKKQLIEIV